MRAVAPLEQREIEHKFRIHGLFTLPDLAGVVGAVEPATEVPEAFSVAMDDDLNTPRALAVVHEAVRAGNAALTSGELARYDEFDETRADFSRWKGLYETWRRRKAAYEQQLKSRGLADSLRLQPAY